MFNAISMAGTGWAVLALVYLFSLVGIEMDETSVGAFIEALITVVGFVLAVWGQFRRSDLILGLFRR
jgi:hypothetical protein